MGVRSWVEKTCGVTGEGRVLFHLLHSPGSRQIRGISPTQHIQLLLLGYSHHECGSAHRVEQREALTIVDGARREGQCGGGFALRTGVEVEMALGSQGEVEGDPERVLYFVLYAAQFWGPWQLALNSFSSLSPLETHR